MKIRDKGIELIKHFEGCELHAYKDIVGVVTIGYGHTGSDVAEGQTVTEEEAEEILRKDLTKFEDYVKNYVECELNQEQFDALVAWTFNLGPGNLKSSTLLKRLNENDYDDVPNQIRRWNRAGGEVVSGLVRRRNSEAHLFEHGELKYEFDD